jgi:hypothetical protein
MFAGCATTKMDRAKAVYTPQVLLQGQDFRRWGTGAFEVALGAQLLDLGQLKDSVAYLAAYENRLVSEVRAGENRGHTLRHDFVVREWDGPLAFDAGGKIALKKSLPLPPTARPRDAGVAAFIQNRSTGDVLQALMLPPCPG